MASNVKAGTMTVTIKEDINLNGVARGGNNTLNIANVAQVHRRVIDCIHSTSVTVFESHASAEGLDTFHDVDVKYIRVTNLDNSAHCYLQCYDAGGNVSFRLDPGCSHIFMAPLEGSTDRATLTGVDDYSDVGGGAGSTLVAFTKIDVEAVQEGSAATIVPIEVFVASAAAS
tara:strand:+ start:3049 stop:3564 length:516 start_codon:yes stop_codon:yes gene_type:complete